MASCVLRRLSRMAAWRDSVYGGSRQRISENYLPRLDSPTDDEFAAYLATPGPWTHVPSPYLSNATHCFITVPTPLDNRYYRLRKE